MQKLLLCMLMTTVLSCDFIGGQRIEGNGDITTETRQVSSFKTIASSGPMDVVLTNAQDFGIKVEGDKNLLPYILVETDGNTLNIKQKDGYNLHTEKSLKVFVSAPVFNAVSLGGSGDITSENVLVNPDKMSFEINGSGDINVKVNTPSLESDTRGSGDITLSGAADNVDASVAGSGNIHGFNLNAQNASITINGSGNADVFASKQLTLNVNGSGDIQYKGGASVTSHVNGSGSVSKAN